MWVEGPRGVYVPSLLRLLLVIRVLGAVLLGSAQMIF